jgi:hypothetical protein
MAIGFATKLERGITFAWNDEPFLKGYEETEELSKSIVNWLRKQGITGTAIWLGKKNYTTSPQWTAYGGTDRSSTKTDFTIGDYHISLKYGKSQFLSSSVNDATATFTTAIKNLTKVDNDLVSDIYGLFGQFVSGISNSTVGKSKKTDPVLIEGERIHKQMVSLLEEMINTNKEFAIEFVKEAITGTVKFGGNEATATHLLAINGTNYKMYDLNNVSVIQKIAKSMKVNVTFKSSHLKGTSSGKYRFWSVVGLAVEKIREEFSYERHDMLSETVATDVWNKVKAFFYSLLDDIKNYLGKSIENIIEFLEVEPVITFEENIDI